MRRETADARKAEARHETIDASQVSRLKPRRVSGLMSRAQQSKISMRFYNDREVRAIWDDAASKWWFSVLYIVGFVNGVPLLKFIAEMSDEEVSYRCERSVPADVTGENGHKVWVSDASDGSFSAIVPFRKHLGI